MQERQHILVFRFSAMGDVAMTVPVLKALMNQHPQLEITMLSYPMFGPLFSDIPRCNFIPVFLKAQHKGVVGLWKLYKELLKGKKYDLIIANINRNILLNDMQTYVDCLNKEGILLLSGFYSEDIPFIDASCAEKGLTYQKKLDRNNWVSLKYLN